MMKKLYDIWYGLSIRRKLILYFALLTFVMLIVILYSFGVTYRYTKQFQLILEEHFLLNEFLTELQFYGNEIDDFLRYKSERSEKEIIARVKKSQNKMTRVLMKMRQHIPESIEALFEIRALENCLESYTQLSSSLFLEQNKHSPDFFQKLYTVSRMQYYMERYIANLQRIRLTEDNLYCEKIENDIFFFRTMFLAVLTLFLFFLISFSVIFSHRLSKPITKLAEVSLRMADGDLSVSPIDNTFKTGKEMETVISAFNTMSRNIKDMVDDLKMKSKLETMLHAEAIEKESALTALREAQLVSLQNQIKPHFLFNTLNTINRQAQEEKAFQTVNLILILSNLMRYNLLSHRQSVSLKDELSALKDYMHLQQKRFGKRIRFKIDAPEEILSVEIPPFAVLTFAENSVRHGLEPCINGGTLYVRICKRTDTCRIQIADTGVGMDKETLYSLVHIQEIPPKIRSDGSEAGIGVRNIMTRLDLFYGTEYAFKCYSKPGRGTLTVISIPIHPMRTLREEIHV
ncbi:histidine kinase [Treponema sp. OMZ 840]|uniref:sensor histidine kinase n=1 Tax=Treponema sp. OMZ 840 TaxID=244313 RepID=UPI003D93F823